MPETPEREGIVKTAAGEEERPVRAVLAALCDGDAQATETSLAELESLLKTAGGVTAATVVQNAEKPFPKTYIGSGKAREIADFAKASGDIELLVFDNELSPSQIANLEEITGLRVIDRTMLILDIFARHAVTGEGKLQVEIACLRYTAPRLTGKGREMSRLGGGIGTRGPGESKLESDRRRLKRRIAALEKELAEMERTRDLQRASREKKAMKSVALVGYTNSGKSTLLNCLTDAGISVADRLFETLDPTTRLLTTEGGTKLLLSDTVGFIDRLPHHLVKAFRSTLDTLRYADLLLHLTDGSESLEERRRKDGVTDALTAELFGADKPVIRVYTKMDKAAGAAPAGAVGISAKTGQGIDELLRRIELELRCGRRRAVFRFPPEDIGKASVLYGAAQVQSAVYGDDKSLVVTALCEEREIGRLSAYLQKAPG